MAYIALYRAWRSQTFSELVGQRHIVQTLQNALIENRLNHAYLFCGPRGTGKTSSAKIFAKALNCTNPNSGEPCNTCSICVRISEGSLMDVIEIDAASNRGIEEIRDLRDHVKYAPTEAKYKVYIIDEVHMLTTEAFNALLKTLEEPPSHVIFIFATTEAHKLPLTIISRCQRYDFRRVSIPDQVERLSYVCQQENIQIDTDALHYIARLSDGGMRDALSLLDQLHAYCSNSIQLSDVIAMTGGVPTDYIEKLVRAVKAQQLDLVLEIIYNLMKEGKSADKCLDQLIDFLRDILIVQQAPQSPMIADRIFDLSHMQDIAQLFQPAEIYQMIESMIHDQSEMKYSSQPQTIFEMAVMKISIRSYAQASTSSFPEAHAELQQHTALLSKLTERIQKLELQISELAKGYQPVTQTTHAKDDRNSSSPSKPSHTNHSSSPSISGLPHAPSANKKSSSKWIHYIEATNSSQTQDALMKWNQFLQAVKAKKVTVHAWLVNGELVAMYEDDLVVAFKNEMHRNTSEKPENKQIIDEVASLTFERNVNMVTVMRSEWDEAQHIGSEHSAEELTLIVDEEITNEQEPWIKEAIVEFGSDIVEIKKDDTKRSK